MNEDKEKFLISLDNAKKYLQTVDHLVYVTFPLIKEQRLLLKALEELQNALINIINSILQYEAYNKKIIISKNAEENFNIFKKIAPTYSISLNQLEKIIEILKITEKHKKSPFEFIKDGKIVIMGDNFETEILSIEKIKEYIIETKDFLRKVRTKINS
ncbi:MAG: hypothetical protein QW117_00305 [Candidatus Pacearchaeota archaeon]